MVAIARRELDAWPVGVRVRVVAALQRIVTEQLGVVAAGVSPRDELDDVRRFVRTLLAARVTRQRPGWLTRLPRFRAARRSVERLCARVRAAHLDAPSASRPADLIDDLLALHRADRLHELLPVLGQPAPRAADCGRLRLMQELRLRAAHTACARAQVTWLRVRLLKLGVQVVRSVRRIVLHLPRATPDLEAWQRIASSSAPAPGSRNSRRSYRLPFRGPRLPR